MASRPPSLLSVLLSQVYILALAAGFLLLIRWLAPDQHPEMWSTVLAAFGSVSRIPWPKRRRFWVVLLSGFTLLTVYLGGLGLFTLIGPGRWANYFAICVAVVVMTLVAMSAVKMVSGPPDTEESRSMPA